MLVFIDESGDPGFRLHSGSSPVFAVAMVVFESGDDALRTQKIIENSKIYLRCKPEFKFNASSHETRDAFFSLIKDLPFVVRAIVVQKERIYSARLKSDKEAFYHFFLHQMLRNDNGLLKNAHIVLDGSGDREFRKHLKSSLLGMLRDGAVRNLSIKNSRNDVLIQLADMCAGAIARSYRGNRKDNFRWRNMLQPKIQDLWNFR